MCKCTSACMLHNFVNYSQCSQINILMFLRKILLLFSISKTVLSHPRRHLHKYGCESLGY